MIINRETQEQTSKYDRIPEGIPCPETYQEFFEIVRQIPDREKRKMIIPDDMPYNAGFIAAQLTSEGLPTAICLSYCCGRMIADVERLEPKVE